MTIKLTGADWKAFMDDKEFWWEGRWYQDGAMSINGAEWIDWDQEPIEPEDEIRWKGGEVYDSADIRSPWYDMEKKLRAWLKARTVTTVVLEVDRNHLAHLLLQMGNHPGVRVLK